MARQYVLTDPSALGAVGRVVDMLGPQDERRVRSMIDITRGTFPWPPQSRTPRLTRTEQRQLKRLRAALVLDAKQMARQLALETQKEMVGAPRLDMVLVSYCRCADVVATPGVLPC